MCMSRPSAYKKRARFLNARTLKNTVIVILSVGFFCAGALALWVSTFDIPSLSSFNQRRVAQSTKIYDRSGDTLLYDVFQGVQRTVIPFDQISQHMKHATLAIEDPAFYEHVGIKPTAILRASWINAINLSFVQGGSTITQQVVKNSLLTSEKTVTRKLKEWLLALKLEQTRSKDGVLNIYLNEIPYGGSLYGVEEAAQAYFGKSAAKLSVLESAYLAALPKAPTYYLNNADALFRRKNQVLLEMRTHNYISAETFREVKDKKLSLTREEGHGIKAPHFVMHVKEKLEKMFGPQKVRQGGLRVITTLDYDLHKKAQEIVQETAQKNQKRFNASNAALVAIDPKTGGIRVMVGSRNYFSKKIPGEFNVATSPNRQPGSTFKPFAYATALKRGYAPETVVFDTQTQFNASCAPSNFRDTGNCYAPANYDNTFRGPVTFREALAQSINIPSIKVLYLAGMDQTLSLARALGVTNLGNIEDLGLTLVLGGGEVSLLDMTSAYGVFANEGTKNPHFAIKRVENSDGDVIYERDTDPSRVLSKQVSLQISDILSDNAARAPAFGRNSDLHFPNYDVAVKTGTTNDYKDAWIIGYTPNLVVGTWAGNNNNESMVKKVAGFIVAPMWNRFMDEALPTLPNRSFEEPLDTTSNNTKPVLRGEWDYSGSTSTSGIHTILHWVDKENPRGPVPENPHNDPQYEQWEYSVQQWVEKQGLPDQTGTSSEGSAPAPPEDATSSPDQ